MDNSFSVKQEKKKKHGETEREKEAGKGESEPNFLTHFILARLPPLLFQLFHALAFFLTNLNHLLTLFKLYLKYKLHKRLSTSTNFSCDSVCL